MYEIPQQLEYKEKIVFGLDFGQLIYAMIFLPIIIILFRMNISLYSRITLIFFPISLAVGFMFFNLKMHAKNWIGWFRHRVLENKIKIQSFFNVNHENIKNDLIIIKNKKLAVLRVEPLNFDIKTNEEKEAILFSFQRFLNSLDFPIQVLMTTETLDLDDYLYSLKSRINDEDKGSIKIFNNYKDHIKNVVKENKALNRSFYLIIKEVSDINIQIKVCEERLFGINLRTYRLRNDEIKRLFTKTFYSKYSKDNILPETIKNNPDNIKIVKDIETDKDYNKRIDNELKKQQKEKEKGKSYNFDKNKLEIDSVFQRVIYAYGYPRSVEAGFLDKIISSSGNFDLSIHIEPCNIETALIMLNKELQKQRADLYSAKIKGQLNPSLEIKYKDTRKTLERLQKGDERLFNISLYINCKAKTVEELNLLTKKIESELNSLLIIPRQANFRMLQGLNSCLPLAENKLEIKRNVTTPALSAFFPFTSSFFKSDDTGVWFGLNKNNIPIVRDIFKLSNANGMCLATSGSGKSYMAKLFISRYLLNGTKVIVIDPQAEYRNLVKMFNGQRIDLSRTSETIINPLDLMGHEYPEKRLALMDLMPIMLGELSEPQKAFVDKALTIAYESNGIYMFKKDGSYDTKSWENEPPILEDVLEALTKMEKRVTTLEKITIRSLINRLDLYVSGVFSFLNRHTNIDFNNKFVCFDIGNMPKQVKPAIMFLVLDYVYMKMKSSLERKLLVIDEAWSLLSRTEEASYIFEIVKTCRKFNLGLFLINQEVGDMLNSKAGKSVLANSSYTLLLRQKPAVIKDVQQTFHLSDSEKNFLLTASVGEGILLMENDHSKIRIVASPEEHKQITTNADEILKNSKEEIKEKQIQQKKRIIKKPKIKQTKITVDENKGFFNTKEIKTKQDYNHLIRKGYKEYSFNSIVSNKKGKYLLRPRNNESPRHFFLIYDIADYLKKFTNKVSLFQTVKPDIVFEINNKKYAIEVETGKMLTHNKKGLLAKVRQLNKEYKKNWFFVVTDRKLFKKYNSLGQTCTKLTIANKLFRICKTKS